MFKFLNPYLMYIKIGAVVLVLGSLGVMYWRMNSLKTQRDQLRQDVDKAVAANQQSLETIRLLQAQKEIDEKRISALLSDLQVLHDTNTRTRRKLVELEKHNADVRAYLARPVPPDLQRVLLEEGGDEGRDREGPSPADAPAEVPPPAGAIPVNDGGPRGRVPRVAFRNTGVRR